MTDWGWIGVFVGIALLLVVFLIGVATGVVNDDDDDL